MNRLFNGVKMYCVSHTHCCSVDCPLVNDLLFGCFGSPKQ